MLNSGDLVELCVCDNLHAAVMHKPPTHSQYQALMQGPRIRSLSEWTRSENDPQGSGAREDRANGLSQTVKVVGLADNVTRHDLEMALAAGHDRAGNVIESVHWLCERSTH